MAGALLTGEVVALYNYMTQILVELIKFANLIISITKAITCMQRIDAVIRTEPEMTFPETAPAENFATSIDFCIAIRLGTNSPNTRVK